MFRFNKKEYIDRAVLIGVLDNDNVIDGFIFSDGETLLQKINSMPASKVEPIIYAKWDMVEEERIWIQNMQERKILTQKSFI